jgi:arylsulfatase A-like enzyme
MGQFISLTLSFILLIVLFIFSSSCSFTSRSRAEYQGPRDPSKPNVVLIMTDDQPTHTIEYMPNLNQELVDNGVNFTQGYVTTPLCCPSRASILTGQYTHSHGVTSNRPPNGSALAFDDLDTIAVRMQQAGYVTSHIGKYLNSYDLLEPPGYIPPGWDDWNVFYHKDEKRSYYYDYSLAENNEFVTYGKAESDYSTDVLTQKAVDFIQAARKRQFFLVLSYNAPHQTYQFAERHRDMFRTDDQVIPHRPPNFAQTDLSGKPEWLRMMDPVDVPYVDNVHQRLLRTLMAVDDGIGEIVATLEQIDQRENTLIIFISDNGLALGEHRMTIGKVCPYEACLSIPFVVSYPAIIDEPRVDNRPVLNIDLAPTILDIAGLEIPASVDGLSMAPILGDPGATWRDSFLFEHLQADDEDGLVAHIPTYEGIRTLQWKYIQYETGETELYDMQADPYEMQNLAESHQYSNLISELVESLREIQAGSN